MEISFLGLEAEGLILVRQKADLAVDIMEVKAVREITGQCDLFHFLVKHKRPIPHAEHVCPLDT